MRDQFVDQRPSDGGIVFASGDQRRQRVIEATSLDEVGNDDWVARGPGGPIRDRRANEIGVH